MSRPHLSAQLIRLGTERPELRGHLLPILDKIAKRYQDSYAYDSLGNVSMGGLKNLLNDLGVKYSSSKKRIVENLKHLTIDELEKVGEVSDRIKASNPRDMATANAYHTIAFDLADAKRRGEDPSAEDAMNRQDMDRIVKDLLRNWKNVVKHIGIIPSGRVDNDKIRFQGHLRDGRSRRDYEKDVKLLITTLMKAFPPALVSKLGRPLVDIDDEVGEYILAFPFKR